ncbi:MAG: NADP oxidoreductase [Nitrososphaerota archaeon]|nr:NADP oxidoreductase [Candidatus Bathyarchaeota archaeon]MDW8048061.1 NADP oxidoreductase [Nitrososphaerota archaeon]
MGEKRKVKLATAWLSGCSGCHMSFLDQDERLIELAEKIQLVYSPLMDAKIFPDDVDVTLVEGAVGNEEDADLLRNIRARTRILVSLGDCAVTGNIPGLRNALEKSVQSVLERAYMENVDNKPQIPSEDLPKLLENARPLHEFVEVDFYVPGCPPSADLINYILTEILAGRRPNMEGKCKYG